MTEFVELLAPLISEGQTVTQVTVKIKTIDFDQQSRAKPMKEPSKSVDSDPRAELLTAALELLQPLLVHRIRTLGLVFSLASRVS